MLEEAKMKRKTVVSWSGGKNSVWTLYVLSQLAGVTVTGLFTMVNEQTGRILGHNLKVDLLFKQAYSVGLPVHILEIPSNANDAEYRAIVESYSEKLCSGGVEQIAFGNIANIDEKHFKESLFASTGLEPVFPLWNMSTADIFCDMIGSGLQALISDVDSAFLPEELVGKILSSEAISNFENTIDICGENGEYHTFVVDGPVFNKPISVLNGQVSEDNGRLYLDIISSELVR